MKVFILAGGFGTRLRSILKDVPKPMALYNGKPFLDLCIKSIVKTLPTAEIVLLTHYKADIIKNYYKNHEGITIITETTPLGTGGAVKHAINSLKMSDTERFLVVNGDTFIEPNYTLLIKSTIYDVVILSKLVNNCAKYNTFEVNKDQIVKINSKSKIHKNKFINLGCYLFKSKYFFDSKKDKFSLEEELSKSITKMKVGFFNYNGKFLDIGTPDDYKKLSKGDLNG